MSDELIGLVRETLAETRSLRADVDATTRSVTNLRAEVDARLDELRRIVTVERPAPISARSWPDVVSEVFGQKLVQYAIIIVAMGLAGVSAAELRGAILGDVQAEADDDAAQEPPEPEPEQ
jgi:hypothetical protein